MNQEYLSDLNQEDLAISQHMLQLVQNKHIIKFRFDSKRGEIFFELEDGSRIFIDKVFDKYDISVTSGLEF